MAVLLAAGVLGVPAPFASESPGPVFDTLGRGGGTALITISGRRTYPTTGSLDLTTVSQRGRPGDPLDVVAVVRGWLDPHVDVLPRGQLFPAGTTADADRARGRAEMTTSQQAAAVAALGELGIGVPTTITVTGTVEGSGAAGRIEEGDVVEAVDGQDVADLAALHDALVAAAARDRTSVVVTVRRDGEPQRVSVPLTASTGAQGPSLGVYVDPTYRLPFRVRIQVDRVGGPSAGLLFALGIVDELTPGSMTGGERIAGTGTISPTGEVGAIGGIRLKMAGAAAAGDTAFLAPAANCDEVVGHVPRGLQVVRVATLAQARSAVEALGRGDGAGLPTCRP